MPAAKADPDVAAFLRDLDHPEKRGILAVRKTILGVAPAIREGIKWKVPSFRTTEWFATFNVRAKDRVELVLHRGAKTRNDLKKPMEIADPAGLLRWLGKDRALLTLGAGKEIAARRPALEAIVRDWLRYV
jgi:hypothetical protein